VEGTPKDPKTPHFFLRLTPLTLAGDGAVTAG
jgi:hypothetical protein